MTNYDRVMTDYDKEKTPGCARNRGLCASTRVLKRVREEGSLFYFLPVRFLNSPQRAPMNRWAFGVSFFPCALPSRAILHALAPFAPAKVFRPCRIDARARFDNRMAMILLLL